MGKKTLQGKRFLALARCSSPGQADTSLDEQLRLIEHFGREQGMVCVDRVSLDVTGSVPGARSDLDELTRRKKEQDDFDVVLVQDASRLTRSGPAHGMHVLFELRSVGAEVVSVKDDLPEGDMGDVMRTLQYYSAKQQAEGIAFASTRGASASLYMGKTAHCKAPPFGIDRLYCSEDGQPKHVVRNLTDGTQVKLNPQTSEVIERFGRNEKTGVPAHYIKQKTERICLVAGDPEHVRIVREIFERHLTDGWGYFRIAQHLNDRGVVSPRGRQWSIGTVRAILFNPAYLGMGISNLATTAIYYQRGPDGPVAAATELKDLVNGRPARRVRPRTDWFEREEPGLTDLLDPSLKMAASAKQSVRLETIAAGLPAKRNRDRHRDSSYILKGLLTAKQGDHVMTGRTTGKKNCPMRYYAISRAYACPTKDKVPRTLIPAESIEQVMITLLQEVLTNCERVQELLRKIAARELRAQRSPQSDLADLQRERTSLEQKLSFVLDEFDSDGKDAVRMKVQQIQRRLKEVKAEIKRRAQDRQQVEDPDAIADVICGRLSDLAEQVPSLSPTALRNLLQTFVIKLVVDLETRNFDVEFAMPEWATVNSERLCLVGDSACKGANQAHLIYVLATYRAMWQGKGRTYKCRQIRSRTAA